MHHLSRHLLRTATLLGVVALLGACCTPGRAGEWPAHEETDHPDYVIDQQGRTLHWNHSNNWIRDPYR